MEKTLKEWLEVKGPEFVRAVGVKTADTVLDFGCGEGWYTVPLAKVVGPHGRVYAMEKDPGMFEKMMELAKQEGLRNITGIHSTGEVLLPLANNSGDAVFCYDVLHHIEDRLLFFSEVLRVLKPGGIFSLYPSSLIHPDKIRLSVIEKELSKSGLHLEEKQVKKVLHRAKYVEDYLMKYTKPQ